ncbi:MAG: hypothetical protein IKB83_01405 [Mycoplasmataceae bacterium]|nr:hypothetical protein [Mycoplasmataceae bacterium]
MKNKNKVIILSAVLATGAIAATAAIVPSVLKNKSSKSNINNIIETRDIKDKNDIDQQSKRFKLSFKELNEKSKDKAIFKFLDNKDEAEASFGDTVSFKVDYVSGEDIVLTDLRVYIGTEAWSLGVYYDSDKNIYEISIPSEDSDWAKEFVKDKSIITNLEFKAYFGPTKINDWTYDFNSKSYAIEIKEDGFVFDDIEKEGHKIVDLKDDHTYNQPTQFRVYLGGHNIKIKNLTIPEDTQLMFINESEYSNTLDNKKAPIIDLDGGYRKMDEQLKIKGAIGRYGDVEYSNAMKAACGIAVILEEKDLDLNWIKANRK